MRSNFAKRTGTVQGTLTFQIATAVTDDDGGLVTGTSAVTVPVRFNNITTPREIANVRESNFAGDTQYQVFLRAWVDDPANPTFPAAVAEQGTPEGTLTYTARGKEYTGRCRVSLSPFPIPDAARKIGENAS